MTENRESPIETRTTPLRDLTTTDIRPLGASAGRAPAQSPAFEEGNDLRSLEDRLGRVHIRQRLGIELDHEAQIFGQGIKFFHVENWYSLHSMMRFCLRLAGVSERGVRNAMDIRIRHNNFILPKLPKGFEDFTILQISDPHLDSKPDITDVLIGKVQNLDYDMCVLTGDFRAKTFGPYQSTLEAMNRLCEHLKGPIYGILGNHDSIRMVPGLESMGVQMLLNEVASIDCAGSTIYLGGIDDAHYYRVDNIEKVAEEIPDDSISLLLSHTPETYRQAAHARFDVMISGHTHGGQICLPGGRPIIWDAKCPRSMASGVWEHREMLGYTSPGVGTSMVVARFNCPPELTLHHLRTA